MTKWKRYAGGLACLAMGVAIVGATPPKSAKPLSEVLKKVEGQGYTALTEASYDDGVWEIEAIHDNKPVEIHVNPKTAKVVSEHPEQVQDKLPQDAKSLAAIAGQLEKSGYPRIESIDFERLGWEAEVLKNNQELELVLDVKTGKILSKRADD